MSIPLQSCFCGTLDNVLLIPHSESCLVCMLDEGIKGKPQNACALFLPAPEQVERGLRSLLSFQQFALQHLELVLSPQLDPQQQQPQQQLLFFHCPFSPILVTSKDIFSCFAYIQKQHKNQVQRQNVAKKHLNTRSRTLNSRYTHIFIHSFPSSKSIQL